MVQKVLKTPMQAADKQRKKAKPPSRTVLANAYIKDLTEDYVEHGAYVIRKLREEKPAEYIKHVSALIPKETKIEITHEIKELTDEQVHARIIEMEKALSIEATTDDSDDDIIDAEYTDISE